MNLGHVGLIDVNFCAADDHTVAVAVSANRGAKIARLDESPTAVHVNMHHDTVTSMTEIASGRLFAVYFDVAFIEQRCAQTRPTDLPA